jgi:hypothetical protein
MNSSPVEHFVAAAAANAAYPVQSVNPIRFRSAAVLGVKSFSASGKPTANTGDVFLGVTRNRIPIKVEAGKFIVIEAPIGDTYDLRDFYFTADNAGDGLAFIITP